MPYPELYLQFLYHFHVTRDYFECHECLEELWKSTHQKEKHWVPLLQIAVASYHYRQENYKGAFKLFRKVEHTLPTYAQEIENVGISYEKLYRKIQKVIDEIDIGLPYQSFNLPIIDMELVKECKERATKNQLMWGNISDMTNKELIYRHKYHRKKSNDSSC